MLALHMPTVKLYIYTRYNQKTHAELLEIPDEEWGKWPEDDRHRMLHELANNFLDDQVNFGAYIVEAVSE
jgi:hypothetical protein